MADKDGTQKIKEMLNDLTQICNDNYVGCFNVKKGSKPINRCFFSAEKRAIKGSLCDVDKFIKNPENTRKRIVVILESPHINEYNYKDSTGEILLRIPPMPAMGTTGLKLQKDFIDTANNLLKDGCYDVILMNAIQYQCSLGENPNENRDRIWLKMWLEEERDKNLIKRLEEYKPDIIFNLCTEGDHKNDKMCKRNSIDDTYLKEILNGGVFEKKIKSVKVFLSVSRLKDVTLRRFVQKAINEYKYKNDKNNEVELFWGNHPSSRGGNDKIIDKIFPVELKYMNLRVLKNQGIIHVGVLEAINEIKNLELDKKKISLLKKRVYDSGNQKECKQIKKYKDIKTKKVKAILSESDIIKEVEKLELILLDLKRDKSKCLNNSALLVGFKGIESIVMSERDKELDKIKSFKIKKL